MGDESSGAVAVSLLIPARDEAESVPVLAGEIETVMDGLGLAWECLWIDDGSRDGTLAELERLHARRPEHQYLSFEQSCGQSAGLVHGFRRVRGEWIVTLDGDLQNDPRDIPTLLDPLRRGAADMVNGFRAVRHDDWVRRVSSRIGNGFRNLVLRERVRDVGCSLRAVRADCVRDLPYFHGMHRFLPALVRLRGARLLEVPVGHRPRRYGRPKYGISNRMWVGMIDTLGVRWLESRYRAPRVRCSSLPEAAAERVAVG
jgi:dolichol-phosphate mannosyltransferase